jgi:hypothetical protein
VSNKGFMSYFSSSFLFKKQKQKQKKTLFAGYQWFTPVISSTWEAETGGIVA